MFHAAHAEENNPGNIVIRGNDADICIIMITNAHKITKSILWYSAGQNYNNTRRNVNIQELAQSIDNNAGLAGAYIFLGSDYTPAFFRKGKIRPLEIMKKVPKFAKFFSTLGEVLIEETLAGIKEFVCYMYGHKHQTSTK